ncbi:MAG: BamA/TamA family outer membrane protein, partial [Calditrichia bacterium]
TPSIAFAEGITWPEWKYLVHTTRIYSVADFLDDPLDPRHGYKGQFDYEKTLDMLDQQDSFDKLYLKQSFYGQIFPKTTTGMHLFLGLGRNLPVYRYFYLGGPDSFVGMNYDEFFGPNVAIYGIDNKIRLNNRFSLLAIFNGGNLWDDYQNFDLTKNRYTGYGGGIQINTIAGPFRFIIGHSGGITYQYFTLGFSLSTRMDERY